MTTPIRTCSRCGCTAENLIEFHDRLSNGVILFCKAESLLPISAEPFQHLIPNAGTERCGPTAHTLSRSQTPVCQAHDKK